MILLLLNQTNTFYCIGDKHYPNGIVWILLVCGQDQLMELIGMTKRVKGALELYKDEMREEFNIETAKKLKGLISPEEISKVTGLSLSRVLSL